METLNIFIQPNIEIRKCNVPINIFVYNKYISPMIAEDVLGRKLTKNDVLLDVCPSALNDWLLAGGRSVLQSSFSKFDNIVLAQLNRTANNYKLNVQYI